MSYLDLQQGEADQEIALMLQVLFDAVYERAKQTDKRVILAFEHRDHQPTILTNDESFAELEPAAHSLSEITMEYVP